MRRMALVVQLSALSSSCEEPEPEDTFERLPIRYVTDEVEIATSFEEPLCGGDLGWLDTHTRRVEELLAVPSDRLRTVYIYDFDDIYHETEPGFFVLSIPGCPLNLTGCSRRSDGVVLGVPHALPHELVHAVAGEEFGAAPLRFWSEGLAEALSEHPIIYRESDLAAESASGDFLYQIPGHFVRWLIEWRGSDSFVRVFLGEAFADVYGTKLEDVEQIYDAEAPEVLPSPFACADERIAPAADRSFELAVELDCSAPTTTRLRHGYELDFVGTVRMIEVTEPTTYTLLVEGGYAVAIGGCQTEVGDHIEQLGDVVNDADGLAAFNLPSVTYFEVDTEHEVFLPAWTYRVVVVAEDTGEAVAVRLRMSPL